MSLGVHAGLTGGHMCRLRIVVALLVACVAVASARAEDLNGAWLLSSSWMGAHGRMFTTKLTVKDGGFAISEYFGIKKDWTGTFKLGDEAGVKTLDAHADAFDLSSLGTSFSYEPATVRGIWKSDGEHLTICFSADDVKSRPTEFKTTKDVFVVELDRAGDDYAGPPSEINVTVEDPQGHPAA